MKRRGLGARSLLERMRKVPARVMFIVIAFTAAAVGASPSDVGDGGNASPLLLVQVDTQGVNLAACNRGISSTGANLLFTQASLKHREAEAALLEDRPVLYAEVLALLDQIVRDYPHTDLACRIQSGQPLGRMDIAHMRAVVSAGADSAETPSRRANTDLQRQFPETYAAIWEIPTASNVAKEAAITALESLVSLAYSPELNDLMWSRLGVNAAELVGWATRNPERAVELSIESVGANLAVSAAISVSAALVADGLFAIQPMASVPQSWQNPLKALVRATIIEVAGLARASASPAALVGPLVNRLIDVVEIYQASRALTKVIDEALVATALGLETAAQLAVDFPNARSQRVAEETVTDLLGRVREFVGRDDEAAVREIGDLTYTALIAQRRGDVQTARALVTQIQREGKLGSNIHPFSAITKPIDWLTAVARGGRDTPEQAAMIMITATALRELPSGPLADPVDRGMQARFAAHCSRPNARPDGLACPFRQENSCIGEGCSTRGVVRLEKSRQLTAGPGLSEIVYQAQMGEHFVVVASDVYSVPCLSIVRQRIDSLGVPAGTPIYLLSDTGEGTYTFWTDGRRLQTIASDPPHNLNGALDVDRRCFSTEQELRDWDMMWTLPREHWLRLRSESGVMGWLLYDNAITGLYREYEEPVTPPEWARPFLSTDFRRQPEVRYPVAGAPPNISATFYDQAYPSSWDPPAQHLGVDLPAPLGTKVVSPVTGTVVSNNTAVAEPFNQRIVIRDEQTGYEHVLGHLASSLATGHAVAMGDPVGVIVAAGTRPHVHWGVNVHGVQGAIDVPRGWGWGRAPLSSSREQAGARGWVDPLSLAPEPSALTGPDLVDHQVLPWDYRDTPDFVMLPGESAGGFSIALNGSTYFENQRVFDVWQPGNGSDFRLDVFRAPLGESAVVFYSHPDFGAMRIALVDLVGRRLLNKDVAPVSRWGPSKVAFSADGAYVALLFPTGEFSSALGLFETATGRFSLHRPSASVPDGFVTAELKSLELHEIDVIRLRYSYWVQDHVGHPQELGSEVVKISIPGLLAKSTDPQGTLTRGTGSAAGTLSTTTSTTTPVSDPWRGQPSVDQALRDVIAAYRPRSFDGCTRAHGPIAPEFRRRLLAKTVLTVVDQRERRAKRPITKDLLEGDRFCLDDNSARCAAEGYQLYYCASGEVPLVNVVSSSVRYRVIAVEPARTNPAVSGRITSQIFGTNASNVQVEGRACSVSHGWPEATAVRWSGGCEDGRASGPGTLQWLKGPEVMWRTRVGPEWDMALANGILHLDLDLDTFDFTLESCDQGISGYRAVGVTAPPDKSAAYFETSWIVEHLLLRAVSLAQSECPVPKKGLSNIQVSIRQADGKQVVHGRNNQTDRLNMRAFSNSAVSAMQRELTEAERNRVAVELEGGAQARASALAAQFKTRRDALEDRARAFVATGKGTLEDLAAALEIDQIGVLDRLEKGVTIRLGPAGAVETVTHEGTRHYRVGYDATSPFARLDQEFRSTQDFSWENWFSMTQAIAPRRTQLGCLFREVNRIPQEARDVPGSLLSFASGSGSIAISLLCD
jgi:hypothetical protein